MKTFIESCRNKAVWARDGLMQDEIRVPIQTAGAVLLAYVVMAALGVNDVSWGLFSALFVVQASIGGTIGAALWRMAGALLGAAIAVALVALIGTDGWQTFACLFIGVIAMSLITARWPALGYGLVTVTVIIAAPDFYLVEGAFKKVLAIVIGSACGIVAALAFFPIAAHRSADAHLADALRACGKFLVDCMECMFDAHARKGQNSGERIARSLRKADDMTQQARLTQAPRMEIERYRNKLLDEIRRFRYTLTLIDRFSEAPMSPKLCQLHKPGLQALARVAQKRLNLVADAIDTGKNCEEMDDVWACYADFSDAVQHTVNTCGLSREENERLIAVKGACDSILMNMKGLTELVNHRPS